MTKKSKSDAMKKITASWEKNDRPISTFSRKIFLLFTENLFYFLPN